MSKPTLGYWSIRGRGDSARMLLHHLGVDFEDKRWKLGDEGPDSWPAQKEKLGMICPNLPYWKDGDICHAELLSILRTICRKYKPEYLGRSNIEQGNADAYADSLYGMINGWLGPYFMAPDYANKMQEGSEKIREFLNVVIKCKGNNRFLCGSSPTYTDFMVNWGIRIFKLYNDACVREFPKIVEYHSAYLSLPGIEAGTKAQSDMLDFPPTGWQADHMPESVNKGH